MPITNEIIKEATITVPIYDMTKLLSQLNEIIHNVEEQSKRLTDIETELTALRKSLVESNAKNKWWKRK